MRVLTAVLAVLALSSCSRPGPQTTHAADPPVAGPAGIKREARVTCIVQAVHSVKVTVPAIQGQYNNMTLTHLIDNGSRVNEGDLIAAFDATQQMDASRDARAKFEDLGHQVEQKMAENRANAEKRTADQRQAEADLAKAELELQKGPTLSAIDRLKDQAGAQDARAHLESLKKSGAFREKAEAAALRILELQRDRQKITMERANDNIKKLEIHAPLAGMVVHELTYRGGAYGHAQEGDQLYRTYPLVSIFEPSEMQVRCSINEPDVLSLASQSPATVYLDAYPGVALPAHFVSSSPIASSALGTPIKNFVAIFRLDKADPHLLPDLSAAVVMTPPPVPGAGGGAR